MASMVATAKVRSLQSRGEKETAEARQALLERSSRRGIYLVGKPPKSPDRLSCVVTIFFETG
jgi:hypothetical protein